MSKFTRKVASVALTATTVVSLSGFGAVLPVAHAQTAADLQAQISSLLATIASLQSQLASMTGGSTGTVTACSFTRSLTIGSKGADVTCLQDYLTGTGHFTFSGGSTGYFGPVTRDAVAAWQAANGVAPAVGYFGPISQAKYTAVAGTSTGTGTGTGTGTTPPVVTPGTNLQVTQGMSLPNSSAIAGAGQVVAGRFSFTAPVTAGTTITGLTLTKVGVLSDSNISNAYLANASTGEVVAQYQSLTNGVLSFGNLNLQVNAGTTWNAELRLDVSSSAGAGNTIGWQLTSVAAGGISVTGLPLTTPSLTVTTVSNPSIATITLTANSVGSTVDAGTNSVLVSSWTAAVVNSKVKLKGLQFTFVGSAAATDIRNLRVLVNGTEVATLANAATETTFSFPSGIELNTGNSTIEVFADVLGSPNRTFQFSLLQPYKVNAEDTQYTTGITASTSGTPTEITINTGSITVATATDSPTSPIPVGASSVTLGKFTIYAAGEPVKVKYLDGTITGTGISDWGTAAGITDDLSNIQMLDDAGGQLGNAISTIADGSTNGTCTLAAASAVCHFGTSSSPINYIVPANTTRVLSLVADIGSGADASTMTASLPAQTNNLEGQTSFQSASSGTATGSSLSVTSTPITIAINSGFNAPTYIAGVQNTKIASFVISASSAQGAKISSLTFDKDSNANFDMQNMKVMVGSTQFGVTRATVGDALTSATFSASTPITVNSGGSVTVDVYGDINQTTTTTTHASVIDMTSWSALGTLSNSSITFPGAVTGQSITVSSGPTLTLAAASDNPSEGNVVMGSTDNEIFKIRATNDNVDDVRVTVITLTDTITSGSTGKASFTNVELWDGTTMLAGPLTMTMPGSATATVEFNLSTPLTVSKNSTKTLTVKGDVASFSSGGATSGSAHTWSLGAVGDVTANSVGNSTATVTVSGTPSGNAQTVYRTKISLASNLIGSSSGRSRSALDELANVSFTADSAYQAIVGTVSVKFSGIAVSTGSTAFNVWLIDPSTGSSLGDATVESCNPASGNSCTVEFVPQFTVDAGTTKTAKLRANSTTFYNAANNSEAVSVLINAAGDFLWNDGTSAGINLEATEVPFLIVDLSYN